MSMVSAQCPECLVADDVPPACMLVEVATVADDESTEATATWICRTCERLVDIRIDSTTSLTLVAVGALLVDARQRQAPDRLERNTGGAPFTWDDLLDFHDYLGDEESAAYLFGDDPGEI